MSSFRPLQVSCLFVFAIFGTVYAKAESHYTPPSSPRLTYNFNTGWKFLRENVSGAEKVDFDDSKWSSVGLPHTWNDVDTYRALIRHGGGDQSGEYMGIGWYRKHFKLPADAKDKKVFIEFEGLKQAAHFFINGKACGKYENGVSPCGLDLTDFVNFGEKENVLAVEVDNSVAYKEEATQTTFQWMSKDFNPNFGGLNRNAHLYLTGKVYQTFPLYQNLGTNGVYVYAQSFDFSHNTAEINVEAQVRNETTDYQSITLTAFVVDAEGVVRAKLEGNTSDLVGGQSETFTATGTLASARFWSPSDPSLYDVYTTLSVNDKIVDVTKTRTGFRKAEFKGGAGTGGVFINDKFVWLTGYAQRSVDDWPGLGQAYPDWMHQYNAELLRSSNGNYVRWMHIAPQRVDVLACDRAGIVEVCPAGDKEHDVQGRQWEQRVEAMRDTIIYFRNNPSILFWEAGNSVVSPTHLEEMVALRLKWDPHGGRVMGARGNDDVATNTATTPIAEFYGVMIGQAPQTDALAQPKDMFRAYSQERRDRAPLIETEDFRDEAFRGIWDDYSPPHFGFKKGPEDTYHWNSETFCLAGAARYNDYLTNRIDHKDPVHAKWSGYASIYWSDSDADGRQQSSAVLRVSGKVDGVRLPKELYYVSRVMQNEKPDLHIIGHWTYPEKTKKTIFVAAAHCDSVELFVNGESKGVSKEPYVFVDPLDKNPKSANRGSTGFIYAFPEIVFVPGTLKAVAKLNGQVVAHEELVTAGEPVGLKLTVKTDATGLRATGADIALIDVEVVDAKGRRCPTDEARIDFEVEGPAIWRGGINSSLINSTNNRFLNTECGINRVAIRSTDQPGKIVVHAQRKGLAPASVTIESKMYPTIFGLAKDSELSQ